MDNKPIAEKIGLPALLGQTAEELAELSKAVLKYQRILMGENPTPVTRDEALAMILEEATDVRICLHELDKVGVFTADRKLWQKKMKRWEDRIEEAHHG